MAFLLWTDDGTTLANYKWFDSYQLLSNVLDWQVVTQRHFFTLIQIFHLQLHLPDCIWHKLQIQFHLTKLQTAKFADFALTKLRFANSHPLCRLQTKLKFWLMLKLRTFDNAFEGFAIIKAYRHKAAAVIHGLYICKSNLHEIVLL